MPADLIAPWKSEHWLTEFGAKFGLDLGQLLDGTGQWLDIGDFYVRSEGIDVSDEFWDHYETFTGRVVDAVDRANNYLECRELDDGCATC